MSVCPMVAVYRYDHPEGEGYDGWCEPWAESDGKPADFLKFVGYKPRVHQDTHTHLVDYETNELLEVSRRDCVECGAPGVNTAFRVEVYVDGEFTGVSRYFRCVHCGNWSAI